MGKLRRRFGFERLESRSLMAADFVSESPPQATSISPISESPFAASIDIDSVRGLRAASVEIRFDQDKLKADQTSVRAGSAWGGKGLAIANVNNDEGTINIFLFAANETDGASGSLIEIDFQRHESSTDDRPPKIDVESLRINDGDPAMVSAIRDSQVKISPTTSGDTSPEDVPQFERPLSDMVAATGELIVQTSAPSETGGDVAVIAIEPVLNGSRSDFDAPPIETHETVAGHAHEPAVAPPSLAPPATNETSPPDKLGDNQETYSSLAPLRHPPTVCIPGQALPMVYGPERFFDDSLGDDVAVAPSAQRPSAQGPSAQGPSPMSVRSRGDQWTLAVPSGIGSAMGHPVPEAKTEPQTFAPVDPAHAIPSPSKNAAWALPADLEWAERTAAIAIAIESPRPSKAMAVVMAMPFFGKIADRGAADLEGESGEVTTV